MTILSHTDVIHVFSSTALEFRGVEYRCAIGENGFTSTPREGGKATPLGRFALRPGWFRPDRGDAPLSALPFRPITPEDGWCDAPEHPYYNQAVRLPFAASHEVMWRDDGVYDIVVPLGFNDAPVAPGRGSAIFFHLAHDDYRPTLGCVAVKEADMRLILAQASAATYFLIALEHSEA